MEEKCNWYDILSRFCQRGSVKDIAQQLLPSDCRHLPLNKKPNLYFTAYCSDWKAYENDLFRPVLFLEAHMDTVMKEFRQPQIDKEYMYATGFDNRISCAILDCIIRSTDLSKFPYILYVLWTDGEETGMVGMYHWLKQYYIAHCKDWFIILDVTDRAGKEAVGKGVFNFPGDPIETLLESLRPLSFQEQIPSKDRINYYPSNLEQTHAGRCYAKFNYIDRREQEYHYVSRMGMALIGIHEKDSCICLSDVSAFYNKVRLVLQLIFKT